MKKAAILISLTFIGTLSVFAIKNSFAIDTSKLSLVQSSKSNSIMDNIDSTYELTYKISTNMDEIEKEIEELTKKTTYLLLGEPNNINESSENYYRRHQEYLQLRYNPEVPKDPNTFNGLDEKSEEYKDDLVSGISIPGMFNKLNELHIVYKTFGNIRIAKTDKGIISSITLPNISIREENKENPMEYTITKTNLILYYYFKELNNEYKLYYLMGETTDELSDYFTEIEDSENSTIMQIADIYDSDLKDVYNYDKLESLKESDINNIYISNKNSILVLNAYYNNYLVNSGNGFFINKGIVVTTWDFFETSLINAQYISIKDNEGNFYEMDGIVTLNPETDIVVIKLKDRNGDKISLGDSNKLKTEDPVISISSKTGVGLTIQKGIVITNDGYIASAVPLTSSDTGSPLFDQYGNVIGMNTSKQINTSVSLAINSDALKEIQDMFNNIDFSSIKTISFDELKEEFYYVKVNDEKVSNNVPKSKWKEFLKIGNLEDTIKLKLLKANYKDGIISVRYQNNIANYINSMQFASQYKENLLKNGFEEILDTSNKAIYRNKKYQIIIMDEFDYLIIVMVKL